MLDGRWRRQQARIWEELMLKDDIIHSGARQFRVCDNVTDKHRLIAQRRVEGLQVADAHDIAER